MSEKPAQEPRTRHPGDLTPEADVARMIRVDHAGGQSQYPPGNAR